MRESTRERVGAGASARSVHSVVTIRRATSTTTSSAATAMDHMIQGARDSTTGTSDPLPALTDVSGSGQRTVGSWGDEIRGGGLGGAAGGGQQGLAPGHGAGPCHVDGGGPPPAGPPRPPRRGRPGPRAPGGRG